ncbi:MAG: hypothetical protein J3K34DRAFT_439075 [Monoraphidium minutum]|nr:MAG: hypothetical protein J3K34DRAFT_439075 [Monoraphidium minutum]
MPLRRFALAAALCLQPLGVCERTRHVSQCERLATFAPLVNLTRGALARCLLSSSSPLEPWNTGRRRRLPLCKAARCITCLGLGGPARPTAACPGARADQL